MNKNNIKLGLFYIVISFYLTKVFVNILVLVTLENLNQN